jgi:hypothetical protein
VGHGLGVAPSLILCKNRNGATPWAVYHRSIGRNGYLLLNTTDAAVNLAGYWGTSEPSSTVVSFDNGGYGGNNSNGLTYLMYCFAPVDGYSAFGSYTGNGSADGPFVYTGFRPRWVLLKNTSQTADWVVVDAARLGYNAANSLLFPDGTSIEAPGDYMDLLSNGFKILSSLGEFNQNTSQYIYAAFAESPFNFSRAR